ncbi:FAD-binding oxidoreductase [Nocardioides sp.]|uniref:FAD-binding oxidoreductase n=1 Tax=Nocardioides sp. TaxID=35761 RepID=UPI003D09E77E
MTPQCETFRRGDSGYESARRATCRNLHLPDRYPDLIVRATSEADVVEAVRMAKANDWKIGIRSGGHSWTCNHVRDGGLLLDLSQLDTVTLDTESMTAVVGPGVRSNELDGLLAQHDVFFPVGHCEGVGLGGYLLQGGFGWNSRAVGMACESVLAIDYVDGDGVVRHASPGENADVYWAARGAGPGFPGIVTRFHLRLHRRPPVIGGRLAIYPLESLEEILHWAHTVGPDVATSVELMFVVSRRLPFTGAPGIVVISAAFADTLEQVEVDLSFLETRPPGAGDVPPFRVMSLAALTQETMAFLPEEHFHVVDNVWTHASAEQLLPVLQGIVDKLPPAPAHLIWMNWWPKLARADMAYSLEDQTYVAQYGLWSDPSDEAAVTSWVMDGMAELAPYSTGIQLADENLARRDAPFMAAANRERLERIRTEVDPGLRFHSYGHADA